jgi:hypothetical protein
MKGEYQNRKVWARGKEVFIGVDVHKESWHVTVRAEEEEIFHGRIPSHYEVLQKLLDHLKECTVKVAKAGGEA